MRYESHPHGLRGDIRQALLDLRKVPMPIYAIGFETICYFAEQIVHFGLPSRAADT